ncbi:MAG: FAD-binding oxidoreductase [Acidimicrobiales bacterium]
MRPSRRGEQPTATDDPLVADLLADLGPDVVHHSPVDRALYRRDASIIETGDAAAVCLPTSTDQVATIVRLAGRHGRSVVARGAGTGLAGGAIPLDGAVVISTARLTEVLSVDVDGRVAWVQPGVVNLDLSRSLVGTGLHFAPDPSSQQSCTIGGNMANNSGGPHCLKLGVTSAHVLAVEVVLPDGSTTMLGGLEPEPVGYDLRGVLVGSEGTLGIATRIAVRLTPNPACVETLLADFSTVEDAAATVSAIIAAGIVPAAIEMMDRPITVAVEEFVGAGYPTDAAAVLLVEVDGPSAAVDAERRAVERLASEHGARSVRRAADDTERALLWKARKSAFGAVARVAPNYYLHDTVVPRRALVPVMAAITEIARHHDVLVMNVFHAGDGNLHPLLVYDRRDPGVLERIHAAGAAIIEASLAAGGVLSGEHGIGLEKRDFMSMQFGPVDLEYQERVRQVFDPDRRLNPDKVLPLGTSCGEIASLGEMPEGAWL